MSVSNRKAVLVSLVIAALFAVQPSHAASAHSCNVVLGQNIVSGVELTQWKALLTKRQSEWLAVHPSNPLNFSTVFELESHSGKRQVTVSLFNDVARAFRTHGGFLGRRLRSAGPLIDDGFGRPRVR